MSKHFNGFHFLENHGKSGKSGNSVELWKEKSGNPDLSGGVTRWCAAL